MTDIASLGIEIDSSSAAKAADDLDRLAAAGGRAEASASSSTKVWSEYSRAQTQAAQSGVRNERAQQNAAKAAKDAADATKRQQAELANLLGRIDPVTAALDRLDKQQKELAKFRNVLDAETFATYQGKIDQARAGLGGFDDSLKRTGASAKQTQAALRQLPAQFSDIFVSLQAGQSPLTVFLQQGAQIKDSFGGIGPALRETATFARGLITPFSLAGAAVVALGAAYVKGAQESVEFNKALILTGNAAGTTAESLADTARAIDGVIGTQAKASEVLAQLAATGKIGAEQFELLATAAISFEDATGQAIDKSIDAYVRLGEAPVETLLKLNEGTNFLTESVLEQVIALQRNGQQAEAARVAQEAYAKSQIERSADVREQLGYLETAWNAVGKAARETWDAMLNAGREETPEQEIERLEKQLARIDQLGNRRGRAQFGIGADQGSADAIRERIESLKEEARVRESNAAKDSQIVAERNKKLQQIADENKAREEAQKEFDRIRLSNLTKEQRLEQEIANIRKTGRTAGIAAADIEAQVKAAREQAESRVSTRTRSTPVVRDDAATRLLINLREQEAALKSQLETGVKLSGAQKELVEFNQKIADLKSKDILTAEQKSLLNSEEAIRKQLEKNAAISEEIKLSSDISKIQERSAQIQASIQSSARGRQEQQGRVLSAFGRGDQQREQAESAARIFKEFRDYQDELNKNTPKDLLGSEEYLTAQSQIEKGLQDALSQHEQYYAALDELQKDWSVGASEAFANYAENSKNIAQQTSELVGGTLDQLTEGISNGLVGIVRYGEDINETMNSIATTIIDQVLGSLIKIGVQYGINSALEIAGITASSTAKISAATAEAAAETAAITTVAGAEIAAIGATTAASAAATATTTATQTAAAATTTAAWTPAAIVSSIGSFGSAAAIGLAAVVAALAFSGGFRRGGYTGSGNDNDIAGAVHKNEFVFDAASTARIGVGNLEALRSGSNQASAMTGNVVQMQPRANRNVSVTQNIMVQGNVDRRTSNQIANETTRKQRQAQSRFG